MSKAGWLLQPRTRLGPALPPCPSACPCLITSTTSKACDALPCPRPASWHTTQSFPTKRTLACRIFIALPKKTLNSLKPKPKRNRLQQLAGSVLASKNSSLPRATRRQRGRVALPKAGSHRCSSLPGPGQHTTYALALDLWQAFRKDFLTPFHQ